MGLTLLVIVSGNSFLVTNPSKASKLLGVEFFRLTMMIAPDFKTFDWP